VTSTAAAVEQATKVEEVTLRALSEQENWLQAPVAMSPARSGAALRYQHHGYEGVDRRRAGCGRRRGPIEEV
jgi:hypothetical protein